ncbi:SOS response-associated peptidase [Pseudomonas aeruginosa]|uniref:SOS response-associated peptidase n=1 Tax=Pseudomonas aeruginosa TaxID=287 RepID=UPI0009A40E8C|nr:SOS response-associated peptidase [Pseudomonas aeruginosa]EIU3494371.1 SOS response-associated peptidase [Pseudomonas aeruginosa]MBK1797644.1 SOS response-associated peptidase [Pseudomonas aeruginosa]OPE14735.1 DUF159 family protein [Pseudomonas aeruginosa]HCF6759288.1 SOS response-associated peptidase [Pseudomonas aeruginosa]
MCSRYEAPTAAQLLDVFGVALKEPAKTELWPGYRGPFIRSAAGGDGLEAHAGVFGLLPFWAKDDKLARRTYNARSETVASKPSYRDAWKHSRHCIIPATAIYEPDWRSGKAVPTRISRADGGLLGIAGLWEHWRSPEGEDVLSYTMLTINADYHPLMSNYHRPTDEKRMCDNSK